MNFYDAAIATSGVFGANWRVTSTALLEPVTRQAVLSIMREAATFGIPLMLFETYRSRQRQAMLYAQGATQLRDVGVHHWGLAADLVKDVGGEPSWKGDFGFLGTLARDHGMIWGGDWGEPGVRHSFVDACHVQRIAVRDQPKLFDGSFYPDDKYIPFTLET